LFPQVLIFSILLATAGEVPKEKEQESMMATKKNRLQT
jgi:hypothetical protein